MGTAPHTSTPRAACPRARTRPWSRLRSRSSHLPPAGLLACAATLTAGRHANATRTPTLLGLPVGDGPRDSLRVMLRVRLFGGLALESHGVALPLPERRRARSLLGWLALHPGLHPRSEVAGRFWPEVLDSSARKSLRTELVAVRSSLAAGGDVLLATRDMVGLADDVVLVDAREFHRLVSDGHLQDARDPCDGGVVAGPAGEWVYGAPGVHRPPLPEGA